MSSLKNMNVVTLFLLIDLKFCAADERSVFPIVHFLSLDTTICFKQCKNRNQVYAFGNQLRCRSWQKPYFLSGFTPLTFHIPICIYETVGTVVGSTTYCQVGGIPLSGSTRNAIYIMVFNLVYIPAVEYNLRFFITAYSGTKDTPEFFAYAKLDDIHIGHCNTTGRAESQNEWERRFSQDHPKHNKDYVEKCEKVKNIFTGQIKNLNQQMNKTEGKSVCLEALVPKTHLRS